MKGEAALHVTVLLFWTASAFFAAYPSDERARGRMQGLLAVAPSLALHLGWIIIRAVVSRRAPFSTFYESLVFFAFLMNAKASWASRNRRGMRGVLAFIPGILAIAVAAFLPAGMRRVSPTPSALESAWILIHVPSLFLGYVSLLLAFIASLGALRARGETDEGTEDQARQGFFFLTIGIVTGAFWADRAWGIFWSWDQKEIWALITWVLAGLSLHLRRPRGRAVALAFANAAMLFTYFGVTFLLPGLHSYV
jgi:ABC-type transport system involved in cytochrome c biogenesis permease subunit